MDLRLENELLRRRFCCTNAVYRRVWPHLYVKAIYLQMKTFDKHTDGCDHASIQQVCWSLWHQMQDMNLGDQQDVITAGARMFSCHFTGLTGHLLWLWRGVAWMFFSCWNPFWVVGGRRCKYAWCSFRSVVFWFRRSGISRAITWSASTGANVRSTHGAI